MRTLHLFRAQGLAAFLLALAAACWGGGASSLADQIHRIISRPEYRHSTFGVEVYSLDDSRVLYSLHGEKLFTPGSTTKLLTEGTALQLFGDDFRFHTRVYRTGPIAPDGTLQGDLVLVASGDPNLSGRIQSDGTLLFENEDHSYAGSPDTRAVPGDPLLVIKELASQVAAKGIKKIQGHVLVDATLFPEGDRELGTDIVISPASVNDNIVDVTATPGASQGAAATLHVSPVTSYVNFIDSIQTGAPGSKLDVQISSDNANPDGSHTVTLAGSMPAGSPQILYAYGVPQPSRYAAVTFAETLRQNGVQANWAAPDFRPDFQSLAKSYVIENQLAEHVSPPFSEEVKVTLKVSQNLHASMTPFLLGAILGKKTTEIDQGGYDLERGFLTKAGLDLAGASQSDGAGGAPAAFYTPDFMVHYLSLMHI